MKITIAIYKHNNKISHYFYVHETGMEVNMYDHMIEKKFTFDDWKVDYNPYPVEFITLDVNCSVEDITEDYLLNVIPELRL